jgi:hypothetical protein
MRRQRVPEHVIAEYQKRAGSEAFEVWPENWPVVDLFLALGSQWRFAGMESQRVGIDYGAVPATMDLLGVPASKRQLWFAWIRQMERAALEVFAAA